MISLLLAAALITAPGNCSYDKALLNLSPDRFDQDLAGGWRPLADKPGCEAAAADLLAAYRERHWGALKSNELHINYFHEGQMRASAGDSTRAVPLMMAGVDPGDVADFADYALGTIAFLQHDRSALLAARSRLAHQPEPSWFKAAIVRSSITPKPELRWPMNLDVLDKLVRCFGKTYAVATSDSCKASVG